MNHGCRVYGHATHLEVCRTPFLEQNPSCAPETKVCPAGTKRSLSSRELKSIYSQGVVPTESSLDAVEQKKPGSSGASITFSCIYEVGTGQQNSYANGNRSHLDRCYAVQG